jgi:sortase A
MSCSWSFQADGRLDWRVGEVSVVDSRTAVIRNDDRGAGLILITCYPFDALVPGGPLRYVVTASASGG